MNISDYRKAMDHIIPDLKLKKRIMDHKTSSKKFVPARRVFTGALAAALALTCLFTVALAASPELRAAVLSFFRMAEREQVPVQGGASSQPDINQAEIGELVKAQYIKMDHYYGKSGNLLNDLTWSEDGRTLLDAKFWEIRDSELIPVQVDMRTEQIDVTYDGIHYQGELYWFVRDGKLCAFKGSPFGVDTRPEDEWYVQQIPGRTDVIRLNLAQGRQMDYTEHPMLYHLDTGETEDLFAGIDPDVLKQSDGSIWSPGTRRALITGRAGPEFPNGREWLYDRENSTLTDVSTLGGVGADMAVFVNDDTLILRAYVDGPETGHEAISCWVYHIPSGKAVQTLKQSRYYRWQDENPYGVIPFYGSSCMEVEPDGSACLIDLTTGARAKLENFIFQKGMNFDLNPSGSKLLYFMTNQETEGLGISQLGVIDLEKGTFIAFDREGYENLHEEGIGWSDDNTVSIDARTLDGETRYMILYQF